MWHEAERPHVRARDLLASLVVAIVAAGCSSSPPSTRDLVAARLEGCPLDDVTRVEIEALDDAPPTAGSFADVDLATPTSLPRLPSDARAFVVRGRSKDGALVAWGLGSVAADATPPSVAMYRVDRACALGGASALRHVKAPAIAMGAHGVLLAGGVDAEGNALADASWIDAAASRVTTIDEGMLRRRAEGTALAIGDAFVVAGGRDGTRVWATAERWTAVGGFDRNEIPLTEERADAGAVLLSSGDGLLVGGTNGVTALATLQVIEARSLRARAAGLARLVRARRAPKVSRGATGEVLVLGGIDDSGKGVPDAEVLAPDASSVARTIAMSPAAAVDVIALPSGAWLVAQTQDDGATSLSLARVDGTVERLTTMPAGTRPPMLVAATDGAPFVFDGALHRIDPFAATTVDVASRSFDGAAIGPFPLDDGVIAAVRDATVVALRYDVRNAFSADADTLGLGSTSHLSFDRRAEVTVTRLGVALPPSTRVALTDTTYGAVSIALGASGRDLPTVELRERSGALLARIGGVDCPWPLVDAASTVIARHADGSITVTAAGHTSSCPPSDASRRVVVHLVASSTGARLRGFVVRRGD